MRWFALAVVLASVGTASAKPTLIAPLADQSFGEGDCGCELQVGSGKKKRKVFAVNAMGDANQARVNLRGKDLMLKREGSLDTKHDKVGQRYVEVWKGEGVTVRVEYTVTKTCPKNGEGDCEGIWLGARITATVDGAEEAISANGYCGC
jgi:hypothetical protein